MKTEEQKWLDCVVEDLKMIREKTHKLQGEVIFLVCVTVMSLLFSIASLVEKSK